MGRRVDFVRMAQIPDGYVADVKSETNIHPFAEYDGAPGNLVEDAAERRRIAALCGCEFALPVGVS
jgi:hypothetical protein